MLYEFYKFLFDLLDVVVRLFASSVHRYDIVQVESSPKRARNKASRASLILKKQSIRPLPVQITWNLEKG